MSKQYVYREYKRAEQGEKRLGSLQKLPGRWINSKYGETTGFEGRGWNMIALPFVRPGSPINYRMLVNQYNEVLKFDSIDGPVPNRGIGGFPTGNTDQMLFALDYQQSIVQIAQDDDVHKADGDDDAAADRFGKACAPIHHEPGFFMTIENQRVDETPGNNGEVDIVRLATIPHGDSVLAMGKSSQDGATPQVPQISGLPIGATNNLASPYLAPYVAFSDQSASGGQDNRFEGVFDVVKPWELLQQSLDSLDIKQATLLDFDTTLAIQDFVTGGIVNIPFVVKQANATEMRSLFWILELNEPVNGRSLALAYFQVVMLEFFDRTDNVPGRIKWPHVSINVMAYDGCVPQDLDKPFCGERT